MPKRKIVKNLREISHNPKKLAEARSRLLALLNSTSAESKSEAYQGLAMIAQYEKNYKQAIALIEQGLRVEGQREISKNKLTLCLADLYSFSIGDQKSAIPIYQSLLEATDHTRLKALIALGNARYTDNDRYKSPKDLYLHALEIMGPSGDATIKAQAMLGLANACQEDDAYEEQKNWYLQALGVLGERGRDDLRTRAYVGMANICYKTRDNQAALGYIESGLALQPRQDKLLKLRDQILRNLAESQNIGKEQVSRMGILSERSANLANAVAGKKSKPSYLEAMRHSSEKAANKKAVSGASSVEVTALDHKDEVHINPTDSKKTGTRQAIRNFMDMRHDPKKLSQAKDGFHALLAEATEADDKAEIYRNLGKIARDQNDLKLAHKRIQQGLEIQGQREKTKNMLTLSLAELYEFHLGRKDLALPLYNSLQEYHDYPGIKAMIGLGNTRYTGDKVHPRDIDWYLHALQLLGKSGDANLKAQAMIGLGNARYADSDQHRRREDWYLHALQLLGKSGNASLKARAMIGLGNTRYTGDKVHPRDIDWYLHALQLLGESGDASLKAQAMIGLGNARYADDQKHRKNTDWYLHALQLLGESGDANLKAQAMIGLGNARYADSDQHRRREDWYLHTLDLLGESGDAGLKAQAMIGLGNARYADDQKHRGNTDWYLHALDLLGESGDAGLKAQAMIGLGNARYADDQKHRRREDWYLHALDLLGENGQEESRINAYIGMANSYGANRDNRTALDYIERGLRLRPQHKKLLQLQDQFLRYLGNRRPKVG
ncbi:MAG: hypothetical protein VXZ73_03995 [Pseudomonadota bacterium]|nr:hypothetical protein [Pseudomonadota bacterium]